MVAEVADDVLVRAEGLEMHFGKKQVLKGNSFNVRRGEIYGFIGPNGAGKTTTIRILSTLLTPTAGDLWVDGINVIEEPERIRRRIGYMPDYVGVYAGLTVQEYLSFFAGAYRLWGAQRRSLLNDVVELTELGNLLKTEVQVLSKGMRQRLCLAQTLIHDPQLLILDEPASGLDPRARIEFRVLLRELRSMGKTVFLSSHILTELSPICDSVGIIEQGELVTSGRVDTILEQLRGDSVDYTVQLVPPVVDDDSESSVAADATLGSPAVAGSDGDADVVADVVADGDASVMEKNESTKSCDSDSSHNKAVVPRATTASVVTVERMTELWGRVVADLRARDDITSASLKDDSLRFSYTGHEQDLHQVFGVLTAHQVSFRGVRRDEEDLESIFMRLTRGDVS